MQSRPISSDGATLQNKGGFLAVGKHITELSLLGEMVADWDSTDVNEYHSLRLEVDSMLEGIAGICPKEDSDTICRLLAEKEQLLLDIKDAMQDLNATQEKLTAEVPRIVE